MIETNIYNISHLDDYIKSLNLKKLTNEDLNTLIRLKISRNSFMLSKFKILFSKLINLVPIKTNKAILVLTNMKEDKKLSAYCYRHLVKTAYSYDVPYCIINNYTTKKNEYYNVISNMDMFEKFKRKTQIELYNSTMLLLESTIQIVKSKNSRKEKIFNLLSK